jgi:hypothetical protein
VDVDVDHGGGLDVRRDSRLVVAEDRIHAVSFRVAVGDGAEEAVLERPAAYVDVDPRVEHEVDAGGAASLPHGGQVLGLRARITEGVRGVVGVLEVATDGAAASRALDEGLGLEAVARLAVGGHRHVDRGDDPRQRRESLRGGEVAAVAPARCSARSVPARAARSLTASASRPLPGVSRR